MKRNLLLLAGALLLAAVPLLTIQAEPGRDRFAGSDDQAEAMIRAIAPAYAPWAAPWREPPSAEMESLLFAAQAALGAGALGYALGRLRNRSGTRPGDRVPGRPGAPGTRA